MTIFVCRHAYRPSFLTTEAYEPRFEHSLKLPSVDDLVELDLLNDEQPHLSSNFHT